MSKRRESAIPAYANSKYLYETRFEEEQDSKKDDSSFREPKSRDQREPQRPEIRELRDKPIEERNAQDRQADV